MANNKDSTAHRITKEGGRNAFKDLVRDVTGCLLTNQQFERWKEYFITLLNSIASGKVLPFEDEMVKHRNM